MPLADACRGRSTSTLWAFSSSRERACVRPASIQCTMAWAGHATTSAAAMVISVVHRERKAQSAPASLRRLTCSLLCSALLRLFFWLDPFGCFLGRSIHALRTWATECNGHIQIDSIPTFISKEKQKAADASSCARCLCVKTLSNRR